MPKFPVFALLACVVPWAPARAGDKLPVPAGARITLEPDRPRYFLGENVLVHVVVENVGGAPFRIEMGGDYRGANRHLRFSVLANDARGREVPDPDPHQPCMGGLGYQKEIKPDEKHHESLRLLRYRRIDRPGTYRLRVSHDFGWAESDPSKRPAAEATIAFDMPTPEQARRVVEETYALPADHGGSAGEKRKPFADFTTLAYPVYLPVLAPRARDGCERALEALGAMPFPEATRELVRLSEHRNAAFARNALQALNARLPDPQLDNKIGPRNPFDIDYLHRRRWLVKESWRDEFAPAVRKVGRRLLGETDVKSLNCGAYVLECLGKQEDLEPLVTALGRAALAARDLRREENVYPRPRGACQELTRAARLMAGRGVAVKERPETAGELIVFACAVGAREKFRPAGWESAFARALRHELPYVREGGLTNLPHPPPKQLRGLLPALVTDRDVDVQIAACHIAARLKAPELREPVLAALRTAKEDWHLNAAGNAALALGARRERLDILAGRLDDEAVSARCLHALVDNVVADTNGYGSPTKVDAATGSACKQAWEQFLGKHGDAVAAGKKFKLSDPSVPFDKLFPGFTFYPRP